MPTLIIFHRGLPILREDIEASLTIGSLPDNDVCLLDEVLPHHARIEMTDVGLVLIERDGQAFLNGQPVAGSALLREGDLFDLGAYRFQISVSAFPARRDRTATASLQSGKAAESGTLRAFRILTPMKKMFRRSRLLIGRSEGCDFVLDNPYVSSKHAEIFVSDGEYFIRDLHSRNGTFLNDYRVTERPLPAAGTIRFGRFSVSYEIDTAQRSNTDAIEGIPLSPLRPGAPSRLIVGKSKPFRSLIDRLKKISPTNDTVLLLGETGVGKDLLAHYLHAEHPKRRSHPFVVVNCATIPQTLADSQLFGHVKGAFSGAVGDYPGFFQQAHRGTLFLDEIGELPMESQARLLRVLEDGIIRPVGGTREIAVDVRIVFATNRDLDKSRYEGSFREDLFQRFDWILQVPPLRERREDIPLLVRYFLSTHSHEPLTISPRILEDLQRLPWRGNIRELNRATRRAITNALSRESSVVERGDFDLPSMEEAMAGQGASVSDRRRQKREDLLEVLKRHNGNISHAARELSVSRVTIHKWMREDRINPERLK